MGGSAESRSFLVAMSSSEGTADDSCGNTTAIRWRGRFLRCLNAVLGLRPRWSIVEIGAASNRCHEVVEIARARGKSRRSWEQQRKADESVNSIRNREKTTGWSRTEKRVADDPLSVRPELPTARAGGRRGRSRSDSSRSARGSSRRSPDGTSRPGRRAQPLRSV